MVRRRRRSSRCCARSACRDGGSSASLRRRRRTARRDRRRPSGIAVGHALASALLAFVGADLGAGYFRGQAPAPSFAPVGAGPLRARGVAAAWPGAWLPAREAGRAAPAAALKAGDDESVFARLAPPGRDSPASRSRSSCCRCRRSAGCPGRLRGDRADARRRAPAAAADRPRCSSRASRAPRSPAAALAIATLRASPGQATVSLAAIVAAVVARRVDGDHGRVVPRRRSPLARPVLPADVYVRAGTRDRRGLARRGGPRRDRARCPACAGQFCATRAHRAGGGRGRRSRCSCATRRPRAGRRSGVAARRPDDGRVPRRAIRRRRGSARRTPTAIASRAGDRVGLPIAGRDANSRSRACGATTRARPARW